MKMMERDAPDLPMRDCNAASGGGAGTWNVVNCCCSWNSCCCICCIRMNCRLSAEGVTGVTGNTGATREWLLPAGRVARLVPPAQPGTQPGARLQETQAHHPG